MIAIGNGETCPFCKGEDKFINKSDNDFVGHCMKDHKEQFENALFGGKNDRDDGLDHNKKFTCGVCGEGTDIGYYNYYAGDTEENILCEKGDCWSEWNNDQMQEVEE